MKAIRLFLFLIPMLNMPACAPIKGYPGPELPVSEISQIFLDQDGTVSVYQSGLEGTAFGSNGIHVLPGKHTFDVRAGVAEPPQNCNIFTDMDFYGYEQCFKKKDYGYCDCFDYLTVRRRCFFEVRDGRCSGTFNTVRGKAYKIRLSKKGSGNIESAVYEEYGPKVGSGKCEMEGWHTDSTDEYVGTGRYTANANGIYNCY